MNVKQKQKQAALKTRGLSMLRYLRESKVPTWVIKDTQVQLVLIRKGYWIGKRQQWPTEMCELFHDLYDRHVNTAKAPA